MDLYEYVCMGDWICMGYFICLGDCIPMIYVCLGDCIRKSDCICMMSVWVIVSV